MSKLDTNHLLKEWEIDINDMNMEKRFQQIFIQYFENEKDLMPELLNGKIKVMATIRRIFAEAVEQDDDMPPKIKEQVIQKVETIPDEIILQMTELARAKAYQDYCLSTMRELQIFWQRNVKLIKGQITHQGIGDSLEEDIVTKRGQWYMGYFVHEQKKQEPKFKAPPPAQRGKETPSATTVGIHDEAQQLDQNTIKILATTAAPQ